MTGDLAVRLRRTSDGARAARQLHEDERATRDAVIYEAHEAGWSLRQLEHETGIGDSQIQRIIDRETALRQQRMIDAVP